VTKRIILNAFHMNCVVHQSPGLWVLPGDTMERYTDLATWVDLARILERGKFDALFLADVIGVYDVFRGNREAALSQAAQIPVNDPVALIPRWPTRRRISRSRGRVRCCRTTLSRSRGPCPRWIT